MRSRILVGLIAGTVGGAAGWFVQEQLINYNAHVQPGLLPGQDAVEIALSTTEYRMLVYSVGGSIGLCLGAVDGLVEGSRRKLVHGAAIGLLAGILLGFIGLILGQRAFDALGGTSGQRPNPHLFAYVQQIIARSVGWALMGAGLGIGAALSTRSPKRIAHGALGGLAGGFLGGFLFDLLASGANPVQHAAGATGPVDVGGPSRAVGFTAIGGFTGLFIQLVEELLKQAWVRVLAGQNEGKDYILSKQMTILGRDERCDVPLFGDPAIAPQHAAIRADGSRHVLIDAGTPAGVMVNGQRAPSGGEVLLRDGDMIQAGAQRILFHEKATAVRFAHPAADQPKSSRRPSSHVPMPPRLCPFCGAARDASGGCLCSIPGVPASGAAETPAVMPAINPYAGGGNAPAGGVQFGALPGRQYALGQIQGEEGMQRLVGIEGPYIGQVFLLAGTNLAVGREPDRDIVLSADTTISRNHARIVNENSEVVVYDNGSANGTYVNNLRISMQVLAPGDVVQFGNSKFRYE